MDNKSLRTTALEYQTGVRIIYSLQVILRVSVLGVRDWECIESKKWFWITLADTTLGNISGSVVDMFEDWNQARSVDSLIRLGLDAPRVRVKVIPVLFGLYTIRGLYQKGRDKGFLLYDTCEKYFIVIAYSWKKNINIISTDVLFLISLQKISF